MAEYGLNLWDYWRIIYKRKWIILAVFLISILSSHFFGQKAEPIYRSTVTLYVNTGRTPVAEITGAGVTFWGGGGENLSTQLELIRSYSILREVALQLGMINPDSPPEQVESAVGSLKGAVSAREVESTDLVTISAMSLEPEKARDIARAVAEVFMERNWERKIEEARNTKVFVEKQLKKMDAQITGIKRKLKAVGVGTVSGEALPETADLRTRLVQLKFELSNLRERYTDNYPRIQNILSEIKVINGRLGEKPGTEEDEEDLESIDSERLMNELEISQKLYALLKERYERAMIVEASKTRDIEVVSPATLPRAPTMGPATANVFFGGAIGLVLGLVAALLTESMDTSIGTIEDVEEYLRLPVLGVIPQIEMKKTGGEDYWKHPPPPDERKQYTEIMGRLVTQYRPKSTVAEAYRNLQTYIKFSGLDKYGNCLILTSAGAKEGKTITSVNCALSMAQLGYKVLLIDSDLRKPSVHKVFGIAREMGLTEAVLGTFKMEDVVKTMDDIMMGNIKSTMILQTYGMENLSVITAGHIPSNPTEILGSQNMSKFIKEVKSKFQVVIIDSAPILPVTDTCVLSSKADGVILVYEVGRVSRGALRRAKMQIENAKGRPIGVVLNSMRASDMRFGSPFYYYYQKYYGEEEEGKGKEA